MTDKRGSFLKECKQVKEERDRLRQVLKEVFIMAGMYYCNLEQIRELIKSAGIDDK